MGDYLQEFKELVHEYGIEDVSRLLGTTPRGTQYWTATNNPKVPRETTIRKIHELFEKHESGIDIAEPTDDYNGGFKDKYINALEQLNAINSRLQNDAGASLAALDEKIEGLQAYNAAIMEVLVVLSKESV